MVMMITETMRATGPSMESRIWSSGPSQGMPEPAAWAAGIASPATSVAVASILRRRGNLWDMDKLLFLDVREQG